MSLRGFHYGYTYQVLALIVEDHTILPHLAVDRTRFLNEVKVQNVSLLIVIGFDIRLVAGNVLPSLFGQADRDTIHGIRAINFSPSIHISYAASFGY